MVNIGSCLNSNWANFSEINIAKLKRAQEEDIISTIAYLSSRRRRRTKFEEGEQNSAYFFRLEKSLTKNNIHQLKIGNSLSLSEDPKEIGNYCSEFYKNLYSSRFCRDSTTFFMASVGSINGISAPDKDFCDRPITLVEVLESIKNVKVNKSPGVDGLTSEFYQRFAKDLAPFLLEVIN